MANNENYSLVLELITILFVHHMNPHNVACIYASFVIASYK